MILNIMNILIRGLRNAQASVNWQVSGHLYGTYCNQYKGQGVRVINSGLIKT